MFHTEIHIQGKMSPNWSDWFEDMQIHSNGSGETILSGNLTDQSAVYGVLSRLSSLKISLVSVTCREENQTGPPSVRN